MGFRCKNCGGNIVFDIDSQSMKCQHCGSKIRPEQFEVENSSSGEDISGRELKMFTCRDCGAELQGTDESQVGFCPYCGGQSLLQSAQVGKAEPERIIPFQVSKERCKQLFLDKTRPVPYLPKDMKNADYLDSFTGIYMPYYEYDLEVGTSCIFGKIITESTSEYDKYDLYTIDLETDGDYCGVPFDASKYFDDEIAASLVPFDIDKERPFRPAYLSGFYADAATVPAELYYQDAEKLACKDIVDEVSLHMQDRKDKMIVEPKTSTIKTHARGYHLAMFPYWFLTWRRKNRVAYAVVNGESGKLVSDLPVDMKSFSFWCAAIAVILFAVLEMFVQPTTMITSVLSLAAGVLMAHTIHKSTKSILDRQTHANDKGWTGIQKTEDEPVKKKRRTAGKASENRPAKKKESKPLIDWSKHPKLTIATIIFMILFLQMIAALVFWLIASHIRFILYPKYISVLCVLYLVLKGKKVLDMQKQIPEKQPSISILLVAVAGIVNAAILFISPVDDFWYYLGDAAVIVTLIAASFLMLQIYNITVTRPLPRLFDREEVG